MDRPRPNLSDSKHLQQVRGILAVLVLRIHPLRPHHCRPLGQSEVRPEKKNRHPEAPGARCLHLPQLALWHGLRNGSNGQRSRHWRRTPGDLRLFHPCARRLHHHCYCLVCPNQEVAALLSRNVLRGRRKESYGGRLYGCPYGHDSVPLVPPDANSNRLLHACL